MRVSCNLFCFTLVTLLLTAAAQADSPNSYVEKAPSDAIRHQPRAIKFLKEKPEDIETEFEFRGTKQIHGRIRYGSADSIRVGIRRASRWIASL